MNKADAIAHGNGGWWGMIVRWLVQQGVSTVILFAILLGVYRGVPLWIDQQNAASQVQRNDFAAALREQRDEHRIARTEFLGSLQKMTEQFTRSIDRLSDKVDGHRP